MTSSVKVLQVFKILKHWYSECQQTLVSGLSTAASLQSTLLIQHQLLSISSSHQPPPFFSLIHQANPLPKNIFSVSICLRGQKAPTTTTKSILTYPTCHSYTFIIISNYHLCLCICPKAPLTLSETMRRSQYNGFQGCPYPNSGTCTCS